MKLITFIAALALATPALADGPGGPGGPGSVDTFGGGVLGVFGAAGSVSVSSTTGGEAWANGASGAWQGAKLTGEFSREGVEFNGITEGETYSHTEAFYGFAGAGALSGGFFAGFGGFED